MSENVKINIFEKDNTSPAGRGIDSTDIVFIPGFSTSVSAPVNKPTLITSVLEFNKVFGKEPRVLTTKDVTGYTNYGFIAGDKDRSYVYAKELLYQGMPVLYSNIVDPENYEPLGISDNTLFITTCKNSPKCLSIKLEESGVIRLSSSVDRDNETVEFCFSTPFQVAVPEGAYSHRETFEYVIKSCSDACEILECDVDNASFHNVKSVVTKLSDNQYEFTADQSESIAKICINVKANITLQKGNYVDIKIEKPKSSVLDVFYGEDSIINKQWQISSVEAPVNDTISDKSVYSVKYITSGGYPSVVVKDEKSAENKFASNMLEAASHRGDAVALIDYQMSLDDSVFTVGDKGDSFYSKMHAVASGLPYPEYGAAMYPWGIYNCGSSLKETPLISMPASFGYMMCVAKAIKSSPNWLAMAGVSRGIVPGLQKLLVPSNVISNAIAEEMQPKFGVENHNISINTITNIRPYGLTLWGNRTLKPVSVDGTVALNFLNTRNMLSDIKKLLYTTAKSCMFEQNSSDLWIKFKNGIEPLLRRLKAGNGISDYQIVRGTTKYNGDPLTKGEIAAVIKVYPMYAVEYFELAVEINDEEVTIS